MARSGADIIDIDWMVDLQAAGEKYGSQLTVSPIYNYPNIARRAAGRGEGSPRRATRG